MFDAKPLLVPIVATFVAALGLAAVSPLASVAVFFVGCYGLIVYGHTRQKRLQSPQPPELPRAKVIESDRASRSRHPRVP